MTDVSRLPGPMIDAWEWQYRAACRDLDTELFFHPEGERGSTRRRRAANAKAICASCPVIEQCRAYALARLAHGGVGEPHEGEAGQALARVGLDVHEMALQAGEGHGQGARQAHDTPTPR